jgi:Ca2+/H+ antiporter, TMEM165/GDT1 family
MTAQFSIAISQMTIALAHPGSTRLGATVTAAFLASLVECVEALTVVLAVGSVRGWRSVLTGAAAALVLLAAIVAALGPALSHIPLGLIQLVVGTMILLFGLRWLRKSILRSAGLIPLHDEQAAFEKNTAAMHAAAGNRETLDRLAFTAAFNITMLEGTEVVFIVIALGAGSTGLLLPAALGAFAALVVVSALGLALHRPLARIPENTLKFLVGVLLSAFGTFWVSEGAGLHWPGPARTNPDLAIPCLIAAYLAVALWLIPACRAIPRHGAVEN